MSKKERHIVVMNDGKSKYFVTFILPNSLVLANYGFNYEIKCVIETPDDIESFIINYDEYCRIKKRIEEL